MQADQTQAPVTIEKTSKRYKVAELTGVAILAIGLIGMAWNVGLGALGLFLGFGVFLYARIGAWWSNG